MMDDISLRIDRIESELAIRQLPTRYALAIDSRDVDTWVSLFVEDVDCGRWGIGRPSLRTFITSLLTRFYRSIHMVCGQTIDFIDPDHAIGTAYCRAEHEDGGKWIVMTIIYFDTYERRSGTWFFVRRNERHWYAVDMLEQPGPVDFDRWATHPEQKSKLPQEFATWKSFWDREGPSDLRGLTAAP